MLDDAGEGEWMAQKFVCLGYLSRTDQGANTCTTNTPLIVLLQWYRLYDYTMFLPVVLQKCYIAHPFMPHAKIFARNDAFDGKICTQVVHKCLGTHCGNLWRKVNDDTVGDAAAVSCQSQFLIEIGRASC